MAKWFVICSVLALVIAYFSLKFMTPVYKVQSTVLIKDAKTILRKVVQK